MFFLPQGFAIAPGFYQDNSLCRACGSSGEQRTALAVVVVFACILLLLLCIAIVVLTDRQLGTMVSIIVAIQQASIIGGTAAQHVSSHASSSYLYLSLFSHNVQVFRPGNAIFRKHQLILSCTGCVIRSIGFVELFWGTVALVFCVSGCFAAASGMYAACVSDKELRQQDVSRSKKFKRRLVHSLVILGTIAYSQVCTYRNVCVTLLIFLQVCRRMFQVIVCHHTPAGDRNVYDQSLRCYSSYMTTTVFICLLLVFYGIGFPALCLYVLFRGVKKSRTSAANEAETVPAQKDITASTSPPLSHTASVRYDHLHHSKRSSKYGFLFRGVRVRTQARMHTIPINDARTKYRTSSGGSA